MNTTVHTRRRAPKKRTLVPPDLLPVSPDSLADLIAHLLATGDVHAGMRLKPVRDLAVLFGLDKVKICAGLDELVRRGLLSKRHGSGTFVRSVPRPRIGDAEPAAAAVISAADILAPRAYATSRRKPPSAARKLVFQFWTADKTAEPVQNSIVAGIREVLEPDGHSLQECFARSDAGGLCDRALLDKRLSKEPADGYFVFGDLEQFAEEQFEATGKLWISFGFSGPLRHHPGMIMDCLEAAGRGVQALLDGGCRRVAMLGVQHAKRKDNLFEDFQYTTALREAGLHDYHEVRLVKGEGGEVRKAISELLDGPASPDGLYVADDTLLAPLASELARRGLKPGKDIALVTYWNEGFKTIGKTDWSRMEISPRRFGQTLARSLLAGTQSVRTSLASYRILAEWRPGGTHFAPSRRQIVHDDCSSTRRTMKARA